jgi:hypothetical protein
MMVGLRVNRELWQAAMEHLGHGAEQVGFFRAGFDRDNNLFRLHDWRPMTGDEVEFQTPYHVSLTDRAKVVVLQWAGEASLVEVHAHGDLAPPQLSASDVWGLREWVPHLFWRLGRRPYAAIVTAADEFDALAWIDSATSPVQLEGLRFDDGGFKRATGYTILAGFFDSSPEAGP